jgi:hypothetical protein
VCSYIIVNIIREYNIVKYFNFIFFFLFARTKFTPETNRNNKNVSWVFIEYKGKYRVSNMSKSKVPPLMDFELT